MDDADLWQRFSTQDLTHAEWIYEGHGRNADLHVVRWPLDEAHWSCEQPLILTYVLRNLWGSAAAVGSPRTISRCTTRTGAKAASRRSQASRAALLLSWLKLQK